MGRRNRQTGPCGVEGCERDAKTKGMCAKHYMRLWKYGTTALLRTGDKRSHPLYSIWTERKLRGSLCPEWAADLWAFAAAVGERPSPTHLLRRPDTKLPYSAENWIWLAALRREPGETKKAWHARKWANRRKSDPDYEGRRWLMRQYKITPEIYKQMLAEQDEVCAICREPETAIHHTTGAIKALSVDHSHVTGKVRGLLCWHCNSVLGKVKDNPSILHGMVAYLARNADDGDVL